MSTASKALLGQRRRSFIIKSAQQEEALHRIWYALRSRLATDDVEGEWRTRALSVPKPSRSSPCSQLTPQLCFRPACGPGWPTSPPIFAIFLFLFLFLVLHLSQK
ncbi:unnamed protein product [Spirodela intermedia]|uniref:Uncharacterized protein n=1 Tax=Spirodela intermedia TaxID=51605 RepID=A0A7I8L625_SPIIN|nr:unnamed protein product [Spirodela intermedia]